MPNPRAQKPLTLDQVKKELKFEPTPQEVDQQMQQLRGFLKREFNEQFQPQDLPTSLPPANSKADEAFAKYLREGEPPAPPSFRELSKASNSALGFYPQMKGKRAFNDREASANAPLSAVRGLVSGVGGLGGDIETLGRMLIPGVSERSFLPSSEDFQRVLPGKDLTYSPTGAAAQFVGNLAADAGIYGTVKAGNAAARLAGKGARSLGRMTAEQIAKGVEGQGALASVLSPLAPQYVVKPKGGNFASGSVEKDLKHLKTRTIAGETPAERISKHEALLKDPSLNDEGRATVQRHLDATKGEAAVDKWVDSNLTNYVKKEMATPDDPVRLMIDRRYDEINDQFNKDFDRAERLKKRAAEEEDPRRKVNLEREAQAAATDAFAQRDFANKYISHLPDENRVDYLNVQEELAYKRLKAGFDTSGMARSNPANMYEQMADESIMTFRAGDIQAATERFRLMQEALDKLRAAEANLDVNLRAKLTEKNLSPQEIANLIKHLPDEQKAIIAQDAEFTKARLDYNTKRGNVDDTETRLALDNPWIAKVDPETPIYTSAIGDLGFDHVVDVLRQDVAAGRITPEQLNKVSMEQAVRRAADFDQEMAIKMRETAIKQQEGFPVYKDYGDEGYRWIELTKPADLTDLPEGYRAEPYKSQYSEGVKIIGPDGKQAAAGDTLDEALKNMSETRLEDALKYEGDTMGHCVGGYCPDVLEGRSRIYSLRDKRGEPHVTVEVKPAQNASVNDFKAAGIDYQGVMEEAKRRMGLTPESEAQLTRNWDGDQRYKSQNELYKHIDDIYKEQVGNLPQSITQIKGKGNARPVDKYDPYTQDFVKSGQWSNVGDLRNTGLRPTSDAFNETEQAFLRDKGVELKPYIDPEETARYQQMFNPTPDAEPEFAQGGAVRISDNPDTMRMELGDQHFQAGGIAKLLKGTQKVLPAAEREANLHKFLAKSQVKEPVFHAAKTDVKQFSPKHRTELSSMGHHFGTAEQANTRTGQYDFESQSPNVGKYHLNVENPFEVSHMGSYAPDHLADTMMDTGMLTPEQYDALSTKHRYDDLELGNELVKVLKKNGYDGLKYSNEMEGEGFSFVPFEPNQIKSAIGNRGTYEINDPDLNKAVGGAVNISNNPDAMRRELDDRHFQIGGIVKAAKAGKGFYSAVDKAALGLKRPMGTGKEFMAEIKSTPGIKATELKGRKLADIEAMPKMTKDQFIKELEARPPVKLEEKVFGQPSQKEIDELADKLAYEKALESARYYGERGDDIDELADENYLFNIKNNLEELREEARLSLLDDGLGVNSPHHGQWTIPGGENYREILLKMPFAPGEGFPGVAGHFFHEPNILASIRVKDRMMPTYTAQQAEEIGQRIAQSLNIDKVRKLASGAPSSAVRNGAITPLEAAQYSDYRGFKNVDLTGAREKVLHVEEIQSDWHQKGRKEGYKNELTQEQKQEMQALLQKHADEDGLLQQDSARLTELIVLENKGVPDAPFKKDWHELALRRVMQEAAEGGYDRVALTKGAEQADRYDLSKQISRVEWKTRGDEPGKLMAYDKQGDRVIEKEMTPNELADHVGKDVAEKLLQSDVALQTERGHEIRQLSGLDLQVGSKGMEGFYDKMLPDYLNKLGKQYGVQVDEIGIRNPDGRSDAAMKLGVTPQDYAAMTPDEKAIFHAKLDDLNAKPVHSLQVTPQMRQDINEKGLPLYQQIGVPVGTGAVGMEAFEQPAMDDEAVNISDNPDTMRMELEDKQFALGGVVKAGKAAKKAVRVPDVVKTPQRAIPIEAPSIIIPSKLGRVKEEVRQSKGEYGARRVERAADEIPSLERLYKEQALREAFLGDNAQAVMTMNPRDFEKYAESLKERSSSSIGPKAAELAKQGDISKGTVPTDEYIKHLQRVQGGFDDVPYLVINKEEQGLPLMPFISGHEGRHRSRALAESGEPSSLVRLSPRSELREPFPRRSQEEYIEALRKELEMTDNMVIPEQEFLPDTHGVRRILREPIKLPDVYAMGGAVEGENDVGAPSPQNSASPVAGYAIGGAAKLGKAAKAAAKPSLVIKSKPGIIVSNLIDEEPDIAKRLGAEARAKRQAAAEAEGMRQELAKQTAPSVGYRKSTPKQPDPLIGTRFVNQPAFGLNPNDPFDPSKFKGGSGMVIPWDSQSRNVRTTQLSGVDLPNQIFDVTHGGIPYAFDTQHVAKGVAGSSGEDISKRVKNRADTAVKENIASGGTGELLHFPITMGYRAEDYALPYSEFSFDWINYKLMTGELTPKQADELSDMVRNYTPPEVKYKGKKPFAEFKGFTDPEGLNQIYTGEGLKVPSGELRKAIADRIVWQKGSQEKLGFNAEDLMNATTYEPLRGVDKGFIGSTVMRNTPGGMQLSPSAGKYPYDTDFSGEHLGRLEDNVNVEALFHRTLNPIKRELMERENLKPYNKESLRNAAIGAIEKRNERISQPIDERFLDDYSDYITELKKPSEYKRGGNVKASNSYKNRASMSPLMKRFKTARQSPLNE